MIHPEPALFLCLVCRRLVTLFYISQIHRDEQRMDVEGKGKASPGFCVQILGEKAVFHSHIKSCNY